MATRRKPKVVLELRFRTKKQKTEFIRAAKANRVSLNEYILRATEDHYEQESAVVPVVSAPYQHSAVGR